MTLKKTRTILFVFSILFAYDLSASSCESYLNNHGSKLTAEQLEKEVEAATVNLSKRQKADIILKAARGEEAVEYFSPQMIAALKNRMNEELVSDIIELEGVLLYHFSLLNSSAGQSEWNRRFKEFQAFAIQLGVEIADFTAAELSGLDLLKGDRLSWLLDPKSSYLNNLPTDYLMKEKIQQIIRDAVKKYKEDVHRNELVANIPLSKNIMAYSEDEYLAIMNSRNPQRIFEMSSSATGRLNEDEIQRWFTFLIVEALVREDIERLKKEDHLFWSELKGRDLDQRIFFLSHFPQLLPHLNEIEKIVPFEIGALNPHYESPYEFSKLNGLTDFWIEPLFGHDYETDIFSEFSFSFQILGTDIQSYYNGDGEELSDSTVQEITQYLETQFFDFLQTKGLSSNHHKLEIEMGQGSVMGNIQTLSKDGTWSESTALTLAFYNQIASFERYDDYGRLLVR